MTQSRAARVQAIANRQKFPIGYGNCLKPIRLINGRLVQCRRCTSCQYAKAAGKRRRMENEINAHEQPSYFVTFTFDDNLVDCYAPPKAQGELTNEQAAQVRRWQRKLDKLKREKLEIFKENGANPQESTPRLDAKQRGIDYQEARLARFLSLAQRPQPARYCIDKSHEKRWRDRVRIKLEELGGGDSWPRMCLKWEYGSDRGRPHMHAIIIAPSRNQLHAVISAWGHYRIRDLSQPEIKKPKHQAMLNLLAGFDQNDREAPAEFPFPGWRELTDIKDHNGLVDVQPVSDSAIATYVTKDLYRGSEATAFDFLANAIVPPSISWPRNPGLGSLDWPKFLRERWAKLQGDQYNDHDRENAIQNTYDKALSLRHQFASVTKKPGFDPVEQYDACPEADWRAFLKSIEPERNAEVRDEIRGHLEQIAATLHGDQRYSLERERRADVKTRVRLRNYGEILRTKGLPLPDYAQDELKHISEKAAERMAAKP